MRFRNNNRSARRGAAALELALVMPLLILLALGCVDFGRYAYYSIGVQNAARAGAEYAVMNPYTSGQQTSYVAANLSVSPVVTTEGSGLRRVQVTCAYNSFTTIISWPGIPASITL